MTLKEVEGLGAEQRRLFPGLKIRDLEGTESKVLELRWGWFEGRLVLSVRLEVEGYKAGLWVAADQSLTVVREPKMVRVWEAEGEAGVWVGENGARMTQWFLGMLKQNGWLVVKGKGRGDERAVGYGG